MQALGSISKIISLSKHQIWIVGGYFLITALSGFLTLTTLHGEFIVKICFFLVFIFAFQYLITKGGFFDWLFMFFIISMILSSFVQNYEYALFSDGIFGLSNMFFFLIARCKKMRVDNIIRNGIPIYFVVSLIGLVLFILMPSWYLEWKMRSNMHIRTESHILEMTRLSAFWTFPYWISYGGAIIYTYILYQFFIYNKYDRKSICLLMYIFLILILAQQRTPLFWSIMITMIYLLYNITKGKVLSILFTIILFVVIFYGSFSLISTGYAERFISKLEIVFEDETFLQERTSVISSFQNKEISFWGDGIGRYGHAAFYGGYHAITDQNYWKIFFENGFVGCLGYAFFILYSIIVGLKKIRLNILLIGIVLFFLIGMFGANCLCNYQQHSPIFWFCLGSLSIKS